MKSINTLIKLNSRELDELRKAIASLEDEKDRLINDNNRMEEQLQREHALASSDPEMGIAFANYRRFVRAKQTEISKSIRNIDKKIEILKDDIADKFSEVKKYEVLLATRLNIEKKNQQDIETKELNEIALNHYLNSENNA